MKRLALVAILLACSGCALTTAAIDIPYQSTVAATPVPGASATTLDVNTADTRGSYRDRVSTKKNGYGMEMAAIVSSSDLPTKVTEAFRQELSARGFRIGPDGATVHVDLVRFYNDFKNGIFSGDAVANVAFNVKVSAPNGTTAFSKYYEGSGTEPNIQIAGGDNARAALIKAFSGSVNSVMSDPDFIRAVVAAGGRPGATGFGS